MDRPFRGCRDRHRAASELDGHLPIQPGSPNDLGTSEVHGAIPLVGRARREQFRCEHDDLVHVVPASGFIGRPDHSELGHVALESVGLLSCERSPIDTVFVGPLQELIVDVGHVAAHLDGRPGQPKHTSRNVSPHEGGRVAHVGRLVGRDTADVHPGMPQDRQPGAADVKRRRRTEPGMRRHCLRCGLGTGRRHHRCRFRRPFPPRQPGQTSLDHHVLLWFVTEATRPTDTRTGTCVLDERHRRGCVDRQLSAEDRSRCRPDRLAIQGRTAALEGSAWLAAGAPDLISRCGAIRRALVASVSTEPHVLARNTASGICPASNDPT